MKRVLVLTLLAFLLAPAAKALAQTVDQAKAVVDSLHAAMLETMKAAQSGQNFQTRYAKLTPSLEKNYAFADMARIASGSHWASFSDDEKGKVAKAYARMSASTYAARLTGFSGERFETLGAEPLPAPAQAVMVSSQIVRPADKPVPISYRVQQTADGLRIVDVYYDGAVSELATQRSQYLSILRDKGSVGLLARLNELADDLASGKASAK
ncbi:MAG: ABC transporter substrate-binding protein [Rhodospirillales bacterium]|nr:ABC transporter substrate-binding protein [Rhodospirillales bacterium]